MDHKTQYTLDNYVSPRSKKYIANQIISYYKENGCESIQTDEDKRDLELVFSYLKLCTENEMFKMHRDMNTVVHYDILSDIPLSSVSYGLVRLTYDWCFSYHERTCYSIFRGYHLKKPTRKLNYKEASRYFIEYFRESNTYKKNISELWANYNEQLYAFMSPNSRIV